MKEVNERIPKSFKITEIGLLPNEWKVRSLKKLNIKKKTTLNPLDFPNEIFEYYSIPAYQDSEKPVLEKGASILSQKIILEDGAVLFGKLNPRVEKVWRVRSYSDCRKIGSTEWIPIFPDHNEVDSNYLYYIEWSEYVMSLAKTFVTGSTPSRQRVDQKSFYNIKIPLPPISEQKKIAFLLSTIQQAKEKTEAVIYAIKELKKSLMKHLFTYGPVPVDEAENVVLKETEVGLIPEEWEVVEFQKLLSNGTQNGVYKPRKYYGNGVPIVDMKDIFASDILKPEKLERLKLSEEELIKYSLHEGDLLFARRSFKPEGSGKCQLVEKMNERTVFSSSIIRVSPKKDKFNSKCYLYFFSSIIGRKLMRRIIRHLAVSGITGGDLKLLMIPFLPLSIQQEIAQILSKIDQKIQAEQRKKEALEQLFKTMLHNLMTGKIRVTHLEVPHDHTW